MLRRHESSVRAVRFQKTSQLAGIDFDENLISPIIPILRTIKGKLQSFYGVDIPLNNPTLLSSTSVKDSICSGAGFNSIIVFIDSVCSFLINILIHDFKKSFNRITISIDIAIIAKLKVTIDTTVLPWLYYHMQLCSQ